MKHLNRRKRVMAGVALATAFLLAVFIGGSICSELAVATDFTQKNLCLLYTSRHYTGQVWPPADYFLDNIINFYNCYYMRIL